MAPTRRQLLGSTAAVLALAGCLDEANGDDGTGGDGADDDGVDDNGDGTDYDGDDDGMGDGDDEDDATIQVRERDEHGEILVGPDGMTLYNFDGDTQGDEESTCYDDCADNWPPVTVDEEPIAGEDVDADLATFEREDGEVQVVANGWPLYYFAPDEEPGDATGQGVNDVWWVMTPDGTPVRGDEGDDTDDY